MSGTRRARAGTRVYRKLRQPADRVKRLPMTSNEIIIEPRRAQSAKLCVPETAFGCPRDFLDNQFVYVVISPRARGLSVGINLNPDNGCNFDCAYCEVNRGLPPAVNHLDVDVMATELTDTLALVRSGGLRERPCYRNTPGELPELRHVARSGDGEPRLCADFMEAGQRVMHVRARGQSPFFKIVLLTNASGLDLPAAQNFVAHRQTRARGHWIEGGGFLTWEESPQEMFGVCQFTRSAQIGAEAILVELMNDSSTEANRTMTRIPKALLAVSLTAFA